MGKYYEDTGYQPHQEKPETLMDRLYQWVRLLNLNVKRRLIEKYHKSGTLLDYGCGTGAFLLHMKKAGWNVQGMEPSGKARTIGSQNGLEIQADIDSLSGSFDVITLWHVLEHVQDAHEVVDRLSRLLTPDGILVTAVPNRNSHDAKVYKSHWVAYDAPRHLQHFRPNDVACLFEKHHLQIVTKHRLFFDTWFNALLSWQLESTVCEKRCHVGGLIKSGLVALCALIKELILIDSSSSLVYIASKKSVLFS